MADENAPNDASRKSKAEGERWDQEEDAGGITNRPLDEEIANQEALPKPGESQPGAHAGHGDDTSRGSRRSER
jgi:hypothetical protein